jgi:hypothetical protein
MKSAISAIKTAIGISTACDGIEAQGLESWRHRQGHREPLVTAVTWRNV